MNSTESHDKHISKILSVTIRLPGSKRELSMWANYGRQSCFVFLVDTNCSFSGMTYVNSYTESLQTFQNGHLPFTSLVFWCASTSPSHLVSHATTPPRKPQSLYLLEATHHPTQVLSCWESGHLFSKAAHKLDLLKQAVLQTAFLLLEIHSRAVSWSSGVESGLVRASLWVWCPELKQSNHSPCGKWTDLGKITVSNRRNKTRRQILHISSHVWNSDQK